MQSYSHHENSANWNMEGEEIHAFRPQPRPEGVPGGAGAGYVSENFCPTFCPPQFTEDNYNVTNPTTYGPESNQDAFAGLNTTSMNMGPLELSGTIDNQLAVQQPFFQCDFNHVPTFDLQPTATYTNLQFDYNGVPPFALQLIASQADLLDIITQPIIPICTHCYMAFSRDADRARHERSVHSPATFICPVTTCPKHRGRPYSRQDKLTEHLWKKHANLGYTKRT
ncbi:hypothetical protein HYALB_00007012 [Hymenoscyphus albidus]|uniref:C2H2-type domain-containing protein n=1 Tax=Hymenoscyphus albidus TaxID=595503 RepID=A0A9N9LQ89_9HELO|nr:hypothetical protein HYALB_00007012 [Hymenoscyphus albidus]